MANSIVVATEVLSVNAIELANFLGEISIRGFYKKMVVITHEAASMNRPIESLTYP